jgi:GNAT superfamily N-acetyltransferase
MKSPVRAAKTRRAEHKRVSPARGVHSLTGIEYRREESLSGEEFRELLIDSTLGDRRPVDDPERIAAMVRNGNLTVTARHNGLLVGVARSVSDFVYATYLSDLAVRLSYQRKGIGRELIRHTLRAAPQAKVILLSAPGAVEYYPRIGMKRHDHCFILDDEQELV